MKAPSPSALPAETVPQLKENRFHHKMEQAVGRRSFRAETAYRSVWGLKVHEIFHLQERPIPHNLERPHSKAEEPERLFNRNSSLIMIATHSRWGEG